MPCRIPKGSLCSSLGDRLLKASRHSFNSAVEEQSEKKKKEKKTGKKTPKSKLFSEEPLCSEIFEKIAKLREPPTNTKHPLPRSDASSTVSGTQPGPPGLWAELLGDTRGPQKQTITLTVVLLGIPHSYSINKIPTSNTLTDRTSPPSACCPHFCRIRVHSPARIHLCEASEGPTCT